MPNRNSSQSRRLQAGRSAAVRIPASHIGLAEHRLSGRTTSFYPRLSWYRMGRAFQGFAELENYAHEVGLTDSPSEIFVSLAQFIDSQPLQFFLVGLAHLSPTFC